MPVYHISNFDVSAVQIDLSANFFAADDFAADYWVDICFNFNTSSNISGSALKSEADINSWFKNLASYIQTAPVYATTSQSETYSSARARSALSGITFKDLGIINVDDDTLFSGSIYVITDQSGTTANSFYGKVDTALKAKTSLVGIRERIMSSINYNNGGTKLDRGLDQGVLLNAQFGFVIVRDLNLAGTTLDRRVNIGVVVYQSFAA
jgi:hypothetical protein